MTNPRAEGLRVFRELLPDVIPDGDAEVDFGRGLPDHFGQRESPSRQAVG
jgi:hypothetical protein